MESDRVCTPRVRAWVKTRHETLLSMSQQAGRIFLEGIGFTDLQFETEGRVDMVAVSPTGQTHRIELKLISVLNESKGRVLREILETRNRLESKKLTHLLILTLLRRPETDANGFIKVKEYCLLGIFVSKSELEKKQEKELAEEVVGEVEQHLEEGYELISMTRAEFLENLRMEEERMKLEEQTRLELAQLKAVQKDLEQAVMKLDKTQETFSETFSEEIRNLDQKLTQTQKQLDDLLKLLTEKFKE